MHPSRALNASLTNRILDMQQCLTQQRFRRCLHLDVRVQRVENGAGDEVRIVGQRFQRGAQRRCQCVCLVCKVVSHVGGR